MFHLPTHASPESLRSYAQSTDYGLDAHRVWYHCGSVHDGADFKEFVHS